MIVAAIPVKDLGAAKQRLAGVLTPAERAALARAMLSDVLKATRTAHLDRVWVVTRDAEVVGLARAAGVDPLVEEESRGHTAAVAFAQAQAVSAGARVFVTIPGDTPCTTAAEIAALARAAAAAPRVAVLVPSRSRRGTNGVALSPPGGMALRFGEPSFANHVEEARRLGLRVHDLPLPGLGLDIDDPGDLADLLREGADTTSGRLLVGWSIAARLTMTPAVAR